MADSARISLGSYMVGEGFKRLSTVRSNTNGLLYVMATRGSEDGYTSEAIYFGRRASESFEVGQDIRSMVGDIYCLITTNAQGEDRVKMTDRNGNGDETMDSRGFREVDLSGFTGKTLSVPTRRPAAVPMSKFEAFTAEMRNLVTVGTPVDVIKTRIQSETFTAAEKTQLLEIVK